MIINALTAFFVVIFGAILSDPALANGTQSGVVSSIQVNKSYSGGVLSFTVIGDPAVGRPTCSLNSSSSWVLITADNNILNNDAYALLLVSMTTGKRVSIVGTGTCTTVSFVENVDVVQVDR